uniref:Saposin B-type domain-containing protein n=1 Tax=Arcella intermedia TaxID=1963864 RepID=A0A6B2LJ60_9EUKA
MLHLILLLTALVFANAQTDCVLCEYVIQTAEQLIVQNATEAQILAFLESACILLPSPYNETCYTAIETQGPQIIQWLVDKESPEVVCTQLALCPTTEVQGGDYCSICELVVGYVEAAISSNATEQQIEAGLDQLCAALPTGAPQCVAVVNAYTPQIIKWIMSNEDPDTFCTQAGLCTAFDAVWDLPEDATFAKF